MRETSTSPGPAAAPTLAPMLTAMPAEVVAHHLDLARVQAGPDLDPELTHGLARAEQAHWIARAGPSKLARKPSPMVLTSRPR